VAHESKIEGWKVRREQLEREVRILVIDGNNAHRKELDNLLFRLRVPSRAVASEKQALRLVERERYGAVFVAENLPDTHGIGLASTLAEQLPHVDIVLTTEMPSLRSVSDAFEIPLSDVWPPLFGQREALSNEIRRVICRQAEHKMRKIVLDDLRAELENRQADSEAAGLQQRLLAFKRSIGAFDRVLVVEGENEHLQLFSEHLLLIGLHVETVINVDEALERLAAHDINMIVLECGRHDSGEDLTTLMEKVHAIHHNLEVLLVAPHPTFEDGRTALRKRAAAYVPWPPTSLSHTAEQAKIRLWEARQASLVDNLFAELYREVRDSLLVGSLPDFDTYRSLIGLQRVRHAPPLGATADGPAADGPTPEHVEHLDEVISEVMASEEPPAAKSLPAKTVDERRVFARIAHSQFLRFRLDSHIAAVMAYLGDLSEGGIFVRTSELPTEGTPVDVDFHVEHQQQRFRVHCGGEIAWVAEEEASPHGAGFGVRFITPPEEVIELLREIVQETKD